MVEVAAEVRQTIQLERAAAVAEQGARLKQARPLMIRQVTEGIQQSKVLLTAILLVAEAEKAGQQMAMEQMQSMVAVAGEVATLSQAVVLATHEMG